MGRTGVGSGGGRPQAGAGRQRIAGATRHQRQRHLHRLLPVGSPEQTLRGQPVPGSAFVSECAETAYASPASETQ